MNGDLIKFLIEHSIENINSCLEKLDFKIDSLERNVSNNELNYNYLSSAEEKIIPLSKILGCNKSMISLDGSFIKNFNSFFDSEKNDGYHTRGLSLLNLSENEIMEILSPSFIDEPIKTISVEDNYYITVNGMHRFMVLKLFYMLELYKGKTIEELDEKYKIKVVNRELDFFKTFTKYVGSNFNPPIYYTENMDKVDWLNNIKNAIKSFENDAQSYKMFISVFAFTKFINNESGVKMIQMLNNFFPSITIDIIKYICETDNYDCLVNIINCINKFFPEQKQSVEQILKQNILNKESTSNTHNKYQFFDLTQKWNDYGVVRDLGSSNIYRQAEEFSENSEYLKKCLKIIYSQGLITTSCCKGNHISINVENKPEISIEAYISFDNDCNWKEYLSEDIICDNNVVINDNAIYYYGENHDLFFKRLSYDFLTGLKDNKKLLEKSNSKATIEMENKSYLKSLEIIGFDEEQIHFLFENYLKINNCANLFYSASIKEKEEILKQWKKCKDEYDSDLIFYISRNNEKIRTSSVR